MTMQRHMFLQLFVASLVITTTLSSLLILVTLFTNIPSAVLYSKTVLLLILGAFPINFSNVLPIGVTIAAVWYYIKLTADRTIQVLYASGVSHFSVILPALLLAFLAAAFGFYLSFVEAPRGWSRVLDAIHIGTHDLDPSILEPQRFYTLNDNRRTFHFGRWLAKDEVAEVFMQERTDEGGGETSVTAPSGIFVKTPNTTLLNLSDAVVITRKAGETAPTIVNFDRLWINSGLRGSETPKRNVTHLAELGPAAFAAAYNSGDQRHQREWTSEAFKRTIPPILIVTYILVGVRLAFLGLGAREEIPWKFHAICVGIIAHHGLLVIASDALINLDKRMAWLIAGIVVIEIGLGVAVNFSKMPAKLTLYDGDTFPAGTMASETNDVS